MDRQTLRDWVIRFNEQGPDGLINVPAPGAPAKLHLDEIATKVGPGAHAIVILDQAGWHGVNFLAQGVGRFRKMRFFKAKSGIRPASSTTGETHGHHSPRLL